MKIPTHTLYYVLCYAWERLDRVRAAPRNVVDTTGDDLPQNLLASLLCDSFARVRRRGLDRDYVEHSQETRRPRGKIDLATTARRALRARAGVAVRYEELTTDVLQNRLVKATMLRLAALPPGQLDEQLRGRLARFARLMPEVGRAELRDELFRRVRIHRNNTDYGFLLSVSRLASARLFTEGADGVTRFREFSADDTEMGNLFEAFVRGFLRLECPELGVHAGHRRIRWHEATSAPGSPEFPVMETDIFVPTRGGRSVIVEAKCEKKPFDRAGKTLKSGHLYQLWAYLTNYARSQPEDVPPLGVLLYATGGSGRDACSSGSRWSRFSYDYRLSGHDLRVRSLDLGGVLARTAPRPVPAGCGTRRRNRRRDPPGGLKGGASRPASSSFFGLGRGLRRLLSFGGRRGACGTIKEALRRTPDDGSRAMEKRVIAAGINEEKQNGSGLGGGPVRDQVELHAGRAEEVYAQWPRPDLIVSDGAYGVGGFPGDPRTPDDLDEWYAPHVPVWSDRAHAATTLWFWNTEIGWATVHPLLAASGWEYVQTIIWDKGVGHIAGNVNGATIRRLPTVTEVCVFYKRRLKLPGSDGPLAAPQWLRAEWQRAGLPLYRANEACGVKNAATRKYLTQDWLWYFPPAEMMARLVDFANRHGDPEGRPYYSIDGRRPVTEAQWARLRHPWNHEHGLTNVWSHPPLNGAERYRGEGRRVAPRVHNPGRNATAHLNQKPLEFMRRIVRFATRKGDVVWEPFGGLCSAAVAAAELGRLAYGAEPDPWFAELARQRLDEVGKQLPVDG